MGFFFERERERERGHELGGEVDRERERERERESTLSAEPNVGFDPRIP